jgi:Domain of unknown function (DUF4476)
LPRSVKLSCARAARGACAAALAVCAAAGAAEWNLPKGLVGKDAAVLDRASALRKLSRLEELAADSPGVSKEPAEVQRRALLRQFLAQLRAELEGAPKLGSLEKLEAPSAPKPPPAEGPKRPLRPLTDDEFAPLADQITQEAFSEDRMKQLKELGAGRGFTVAQVARLLTAFPFSADRMRAFHLLWPRVVDRHNGAQLEESFTLDSEKEEIHAAVAE